ncbi:MAG: hypothetical protein AAFX99_06880, partial [Myxococcota bacterium]
MRAVVGILCLVLWVGAWGCTGSSVNAPKDPASVDRSLRPGLSLLTPYDFEGRTLQGLRWLDNFALGQPLSASGHRARYWLLRARLDWLTQAYLAEDMVERVALLHALMDHLQLEHGDSPDNAELFAVVDTLEGQARGLGRITQYKGVSEGALALLQVFRNLDLSSGYFEGIGQLRQAIPTEGLPSIDDAGVFAPNALLIASADLLVQLPTVDRFSPDRQPHLLAQLGAYGCPQGLVAFAQASLEGRESMLQELCGWPCPEVSQLSDPKRKAVVDTCGVALGMDGGLFSTGNVVVVRVLDELDQLSRQGLVLVSQPESAQRRFPVLRGQLGVLERLRAMLLGRFFTLDLPEYRGELGGVKPLTLAGARYTRPPEPTALVVSVASDGSGVVWHQPVAQVTEDGGVVLGTGHHQVVEGVLRGYGDDERSRAVWDDAVTGVLGQAASVFGFDAGAVGAKNIVPKVALDASVSVDVVLALGAAMAGRGHPRVDMVVADTELQRSGLVQLWLRQGSPAGGDEVRVEVGRQEIVLVVAQRGGKALRRTFPTVNGQHDWRGLYLA